MANLLMISGDRSLARGKHGAFYSTLEELHKHWDRIDVICPNPGVQRYDMQVFGNVYIHPSPWPLVLQWLWIFREGRRIVAAHHPALMTVHEYAPVFNGIGARWLQRSSNVPYVLEVMHVPGLPRAVGMWEAFNRWLTRIMIARQAKRAVAVRVINEHQVPDFLVAAGIPRAKLRYLPAFYIDLETFKPADVLKQYDIAFVGRLASNKGLDLFLDILKRTGLVGVVVGDGPLLDGARSRAKRQDLKVHFAGFAPDAAAVADILNRSKLLVMPSYNEGGPRVVLEALACGVPVVATPVGIVPDVLPPEAIEEWDAAALADKVKNILGDSALYERLRSAGLITAQHFERKAAIAAYADGLKEYMKP